MNLKLILGTIVALALIGGTSYCGAAYGRQATEIEKARIANGQCEDRGVWAKCK